MSIMRILLSLVFVATAQAVQFVPITPPAQPAHPAVNDIAVAGGTVCAVEHLHRVHDDFGCLPLIAVLVVV